MTRTFGWLALGTITALWTWVLWAGVRKTRRTVSERQWNDPHTPESMAAVVRSGGDA